MLRPILAIALIALGTAAQAQHAHSAAAPTEPGQSAFAAIAEIVAILRADPATDWSKVDVPALQRHLVDMDLVTTGAVATTSRSDDAVVFKVTGPEPVVAALHRMAPAHAPVLDDETGWTTSVETRPDGIEMRIEGEADMIAALGFHGVMAIGDHHRQHHLALALGGMPHH